MGLNLDQHLPLPTFPDTTFQYLSREDWGLNDAEVERRNNQAKAAGRSGALFVQQRNLPYVFVHHTDGQTPDLSPPIWDDDPIAFMQHLDRYAREGKGYLGGVDYSVVGHYIQKNNKGIMSVIEGRAEFVPAATKDMNSLSKALCLAGSFHPESKIATKRMPRIEEIIGLRWANTALKAAGYVAVNAYTLPHSANPLHPNATSCCGDWLRAQMPAIRQMWTPPIITDPNPTKRKEDMIEAVTYENANGIRAIFLIYGGYKVWVETQEQWRTIRADFAKIGRVLPSVPATVDAAYMRARGRCLDGRRPAGSDEFGA